MASKKVWVGKQLSHHEKFSAVNEEAKALYAILWQEKKSRRIKKNLRTKDLRPDAPVLFVTEQDDLENFPEAFRRTVLFFSFGTGLQVQ